MAFNAFGHMTIAGVLLYPVLGDFSPALGMAIFGSLLPDIDHPRSVLGSVNPFTPWMRHRGHCHTVVGCILLALPFAALEPVAVQWVGLGAFSHLLADKLYSWLPGRQYFSIKLW